MITERAEEHNRERKNSAKYFIVSHGIEIFSDHPSLRTDPFSLAYPAHHRQHHHHCHIFIPCIQFHHRPQN